MTASRTDALAEIVARLRDAQARAGYAVHAPASPADIAVAAAAVAAEFGQSLPADYGAFLALCDGADFDGLVLYDCASSPEAPRPGGFWQGLVDVNRLWRADGWMPAGLVLGDSDLDVLVAEAEGFALRDRVSDDPVACYPDLAGALAALLEPRL